MSIPTKHAPLTVDDVRPTEVTVHLEPTISLGTTDAPVDAVDPADVFGDAEADTDLVALVRDAAGLLGPRTWAVIDLSVIQGLADSEVGTRVGIRDDIATATVARTRERVAEALTIFVLVKTRTNDCPGLRRVVGAHARASLDADRAEVVATHLDACPGCADAWRRIPPPLEVLSQSQPRRGRGSIRDRIRRRTIGAGNTPSTRSIQAAGAVALIAVVLGVVVVVSGGGEPHLVAAPTGPVIDVAAASPNQGNWASTPTPGVTTRRQPRSTVAANTPPTVAAEPKPAKPHPTTTLAPASEAPLVTIISPFNGQVFTSAFGHQRIDLVAVVQDDNDGRLEVDWYEGTTYLGTGNAITVITADSCQDSMTHTVSASVTDSSGNTSVADATFTVRCENAVS